MSTSAPNPSSTPSLAVDMVLPLEREWGSLRADVHGLHDFLSEHLGASFAITIAQSTSSAATLQSARELASELEPVRVLELERQGRGHALREAWRRSEAEVVGYIDLELATDLTVLPALLEPLLAGRGDLTIGSRLLPGSEAGSSLSGALVLRARSLLLQLLLESSFSDAQFPLKAARRAVITPLLEQVQDESWFFDTELLHLAQRSRLAIHELPVRCRGARQDPPAEHEPRTLDDLRALRRLRRRSRAARAPVSSTAQGPPAGTRHARRGEALRA